MQAPKSNPVPLPPPPARPVDDAILEARRQQRRMAAGRQGFKATKLTGPQGVTDTLSQPTMLGR